MAAIPIPRNQCRVLEKIAKRTALKMVRQTFVPIVVAILANASHCAHAFISESPRIAGLLYRRVPFPTGINAVVKAINDPSGSTGEPVEIPDDVDAAATALPSLTFDEELSGIVHSVTEAAVGSISSNTYGVTVESIRDSRSKAQKRLGRSAFEQEKAAQRIKKLRDKLEKEIGKIELELQEKTARKQETIDEEMDRISGMIQSVLSLERSRESQILELITSLKSSINSKESDIAAAEEITSEMMKARSKLKSGSVASQLDDLLKQKIYLTAIERTLVTDLEETVSELQSFIASMRTHVTQVQDAIRHVVRPEAALESEEPYDWADVIALEGVLDLAATNSAAGEAQVLSLSKRFEQALVSMSAVLGEPVPKDLAMEARETYPDIKVALDGQAIELAELKDKDDSELIQVLAKSIGKAAFRSSKAAVFGMKAFLDANAEATAKNDGVTRDTEDSSGSTDNRIGNKIQKTESAQKAKIALKETSNDLESAFNAVAALGMKSVNKLVGRAD